MNLSRKSRPPRWLLQPLTGALVKGSWKLNAKHCTYNYSSGRKWSSLRGRPSSSLPIVATSPLLFPRGRLLCHVYITRLQFAASFLGPSTVPYQSKYLFPCAVFLQARKSVQKCPKLQLTLLDLSSTCEHFPAPGCSSESEILTVSVSLVTSSWPSLAVVTTFQCHFAVFCCSPHRQGDYPTQTAQHIVPSPERTF